LRSENGEVEQPVFVNRFTDETMQKFIENDFSVRDQYMLSQMRNEMIINMIPQSKSLMDWLFEAEPSILKPR
jgi:hypothetical protein